MEAKYSKKSKMTLEELQAQYGAEMKRRNEERKQKRYAYMEKNGYFHSAKEMIDFVLSGGKIEERLEGEWKQIIDGKLIHHKMYYNDIDMPIGFGNVSQSIEDFKAWAYKCEEFQKESGSPFVNEYWHKEIELEKEF